MRLPRNSIDWQSTPNKLRLIGQQKFATIVGNSVQRLARHQSFEVIQVLAPVREHVNSLRSLPQLHKTSVINEHVGAPGRVGTILKIVYSAIQQECRPVRIKKYRRKRIIRAVEHQ